MSTTEFEASGSDTAVVVRGDQIMRAQEIAVNASDLEEPGQVSLGIGITQEQLKLDAERRIAELVELTRIAEEWRARAGAAKKELRLSKRAAGVLEAELDELKKKNTELSAVADRRRSQGEAAKSELRKVSVQLARARAEAQSWQARATAMESQVSELLVSTSWRVTRPLRWMRTVWLRGRGQR